MHLLKKTLFKINLLLGLAIFFLINSKPSFAQDSLRIYANQGYPFVKAYLDESDKWIYDLGDYYLWQGIINDTLLKTPASTLAYIAGISLDDAFKQSDFENAIDRLERTNWFESLCSAQLFKQAHRQKLVLATCLREINQNSIEGSMGYENSENSNALQGYLHLELNNLNGSGHSLMFAGQWLDPLQEIKLEYQYIHLLDFLIDLNLSALHYQDSLQQEQHLGFNFARSRFDFWRPFVGYQMGLFNSLNTELNEQRQFWNSYRGGLEWGFFRFAPAKINFKGKLQVILHDFDEWVNQYSLRNEIKIPLHKLQLKHEWSWAMTWPYVFKSQSLINKLGGHQNLRGYPLNAFATAWFHLVSTELRWAANSYLLPGIFYDAAYFENLSYAKEYRDSYGITLNFQSPNRRWSAHLSYAINPERSFEEGWIHFLLRHQF